MKKCFFILFSFFLLSNNFAFASEPEESYEEGDSDEDDEEAEEESNAEETDNSSSEESGEQQNNLAVNAGNQSNNNMMAALEQAQIVQENKQQVRQTVDDMLGINRSALSAKQQKKEREENLKLKKEVEKLRGEVSELKKLSKESQKKEKDTQRLLNRLQKELAERENEPPKEEAPKPKPKKKPVPKKKKAKPAKQRKIYTVKKDRIPEYENYLRDFMPTYLGPSQQSFSRNYDVNSLLKQSQTQYPTQKYGTSAASFTDYQKPSSLSAQNKVIVLKENGVSRYTVKNPAQPAPPKKFQPSTPQPPRPIGVDEMKDLYGPKGSKKTYFKGKCGCKNKKKQQSGGFFENFNLFG